MEPLYGYQDHGRPQWEESKVTSCKSPTWRFWEPTTLRAILFNPSTKRPNIYEQYHIYDHGYQRMLSY
jgi:hypothetical protein